MSKKRDLPRLAAGEVELLQMLWRAGGVTIIEAQRELGLPIGYTTVQTRLDRLVKKGIAKKSPKRPAKYSAAVTPEAVRGQDLDLLVEKMTDGEVVPLVAHLVGRRSLSRQEIRQLKQLIAAAERCIDDDSKDKKGGRI